MAKNFRDNKKSYSTAAAGRRIISTLDVISQI